MNYSASSFSCGGCTCFCTMQDRATDSNNLQQMMTVTAHQLNTTLTQPTVMIKCIISSLYVPFSTVLTLESLNFRCYLPDARMCPDNRIILADDMRSEAGAVLLMSAACNPDSAQWLQKGIITPHNSVLHKETDKLSVSSIMPMTSEILTAVVLCLLLPT